jgi:hypothetical protein
MQRGAVRKRNMKKNWSEAEKTIIDEVMIGFQLLIRSDSI